jgi:hypothetical protein
MPISPPLTIESFIATTKGRDLDAAVALYDFMVAVARDRVAGHSP